jgi:hypothetical protein
VSVGPALCQLLKNGGEKVFLHKGKHLSPFHSILAPKMKKKTVSPLSSLQVKPNPDVTSQVINWAQTT